MSRRTWCRSVAAGFAFSVAAGCSVGPSYERPRVVSPSAFRAPAAVAGTSSHSSLAEQRWAEVFTDPSLQALIQSALSGNYDLGIAATRVLTAEARLGVVRSAGLPTLGAYASVEADRSRAGGRGDPSTGGLFRAGASLSWEVEFWGKYTRAKEAARAEILSSEWGRRAVVTSLVSQVATAYYQLLAFDRGLDIAERTLASREESLRITQVRDQGGAGSLVDVKQAELLVYGARAQIVDLKRLIEQQENAIAALTGKSPGPVARAAQMAPEAGPTEIPTGLPSALLERRPDILQAEQRLVAANAEIGVAQADYFPSISLTASGGVASAALSTLFSAPAIVWSAAASLAQPIFDGGRTDSQVRLAELEREVALASYRQTILTAFREVSDALVGYQRGREFRAIQAELVGSAREARRLADLRYQGGATGYLEVLDSDTRLFTAELGLVQAELSVLSVFVEIYRALGGGWQS